MMFFGLVLASVAAMNVAVDEPPLYFDVIDTGDAAMDRGDKVEPWRVVDLEPEYGGLWVVAGDIDCDGRVEIVSCENHNEGDVHYTSTAVAQSLDGEVLWRWGQPEAGRKKWHHDVACQIHDWDNDGKPEVVLCTKGFVVELDGASGEERRRFAIPDHATDCLVFCDLASNEYRGDVLVKTRYSQIWAYDRHGKRLWDVAMPGGYRTAHQPRPMDIDGDGREEILAGYAMLDPDGTVRWVFESEKVDQKCGHLDCARVVRKGQSPADWRIALTCCGANNVAMVDGNGRVLWEVSGHHFESLDVGRIFPDRPGPHIIVDVDHQPYGNSPIWILDNNGKLLGRIVTDYSRHHALVDWAGDGSDEIVVAHNGAVYDHRGKRQATLVLAASLAAERRFEKSVLVGDMSGDGVPDVTLTTPNRVYIYRNESVPHTDAPETHAGTEPNFTLY